MKKLVFTYLIIGNTLVFGQINRYWNNNFNAEASLTSGAVVASGAGPTALFFNPAQIAETKYANLTFNANAGTIDYYKGKNALGEGQTIDETNIYIYPRFFSIMAKIVKLESMQFQLAVFTRDREEFRYKNFFTEKIDSTQNILSYDYNNYYDDTYIGLGCGINVSKKVNIGFSLFSSIKTIKNRLEESASSYRQDSPNQDQPISTLSYKQESYVNTGDLLLKIGLQYKLIQWCFGLNITTPNIKIYQSARADKSYLAQNAADSQGNSIINQTAIAFDNNAKGTIKTPFSVALGGDWTSLDAIHKLSFKVEYFHKINPYLLVDSHQQWSKSYANSLFSDNPLDIYHQAQSVTNLAFGYSFQKSEHLNLMGGIRTDFNSLLKAENLSNQLFSFDYNMYHFTTGVGLKVMTHDVIFGVEYSLGKNNKMPTLANINSSENSLTLNPQSNSTFSFNRHRFGAYLGITFNFGAGEKDAIIEIN